MAIKNHIDQELKDEVLMCEDCHEEFIFYKGEKEFFLQREKEMKQLDAKAEFKRPKRCKLCRKAYKAERARIIAVQLKEKQRLEQNRPKLERWKTQIEDLRKTIESERFKDQTISSYVILTEHVELSIV